MNEGARGENPDRRWLGDRRSHPHRGRRRTDREPQRGWIPAATIAAVVALLDWTAKWWVAQTIPLRELRVVWEGKLALLHVRNDAMILGLYSDLPLQSRQVIATLCGLLGAVLLFEVTSRGHRLPPHRRKWAWMFVGLASGGMLGNLGERLVHWGVTDYLSIGWRNLWLPPGNIADLAIFASIPLALLVMIFEMEARMNRADRGAAPADGSLVPEIAGTGD